MPRSRTDPNARVRRPPGWGVTDRPLTVAVLGWARLSFQAREGSGYNLNASELAAGLAMSGHRVLYLASGMRYSLRPWAHVRRREAWRGVECFDLVNSRNLAPAAVNFRNMAAERSDPGTARVVVAWLDRFGVDVVHVHSLEGLGLDVIGAVRRSGRPVVVTPHNYWYACPQVDLLRGESAVCSDYDGGRACVGCLEAPRAGPKRLKRRLGQTIERLGGPGPADAVRGLIGRARDATGSWLRTPGRGRSWSRTPAPDPETALGFAVGPGDDGHDGTIEHHLRLTRDETPKDVGVSAIDENERFLRGERHLVVLNDYGRRRLDGLAALAQASLVTPPSAFMAGVYVRMGVEPARVRVVRLGQPHFDQIHRKARRGVFYGRRPWDPGASSRPLRLAFLGTTRPNKGLEVLARAIPLLDAGVRRRCQFLVRASGWDWPFRKRLSRFPEVSFAGGYDLLQLLSMSGEYDVGILPHVWFENSPLVLLEHLHAGKFVIASRLGGVPEWVIEPGAGGLGNGLLFEGGDPRALAERISRIVRGEVTLPSAAEVHAATPNLRCYPEHVREVESIYRELLSEDRPGGGPVVRALATGASGEAAAGTPDRAGAVEPLPVVRPSPARPSPAL